MKKSSSRAVDELCRLTNYNFKFLPWFLHCCTIYFQVKHIKVGPKQYTNAQSMVQISQYREVFSSTVTCTSHYRDQMKVSHIAIWSGSSVLLQAAGITQSKHIYGLRNIRTIFHKSCYSIILFSVSTLYVTIDFYKNLISGLQFDFRAGILTEKSQLR